MAEGTENKRLFVGGLFNGITETDLHDRFQKFAKVVSIELKIKKDVEGALLSWNVHNTTIKHVYNLLLFYLMLDHQRC